MTKKLRAVGYVGINKGNQHKAFQDPEQEMTNYICSNEEWEFVGVYCDIKTGDDISECLAFQELMQKVRNNDIDVIVVRSMYIISSDENDFYEIYKELEKHNVKLYFAIAQDYFPECNRENLREKLNEMTSKMGDLIYKREKAYELALRCTAEAAENLYHHLYYRCNCPISESMDMYEDRVIEIKVGRYHATLALTSETWEAITDALLKIKNEMS